AAALAVYGIAFIVIERLRKRKNKEYRIETVYDLSYKTSFLIGCFQVLSLVPGTSRSGSTILGGMLLGVSRPDASEFSFFMALPVMAGASLIRGLKTIYEGVSFTTSEWLALAVGALVAFGISLVAIRFLMNFVKRHSFEAFGWYRIAFGVIVLVFALIFIP
ncbi:MAG: undecaprenyl-diphosphate phosphatase, partial [Clostridia bacterium]|nr:undecaprenyl-diphosphate phosphatase [Clostridia bacterium]